MHGDAAKGYETTMYPTNDKKVNLMQDNDSTAQAWPSVIDPVEEAVAAALSNMSKQFMPTSISVYNEYSVVPHRVRVTIEYVRR